MQLKLAFGAALACLALAAACGGDPASGSNGSASTSCKPYTPPSSFDAEHPAVSFRADVLPIFQRSCAFASCHGASAQGGLGLATSPASVHTSLVGVPSKGLPSMARVKAGDTGESFLLHKVNGDACALAGCTDDCAESMPQGLPLLAEADRMKLFAWVAQGATDDAVSGSSSSGTPDAGE